MSSISFNSQINQKRLDTLLKLFVERRYFVSFETDSSPVIKLQTPSVRIPIRVRESVSSEGIVSYKLIPKQNL
jgi:hypothetical protein